MIKFTLFHLENMNTISNIRQLLGSELKVFFSNEDNFPGIEVALETGAEEVLEIILRNKFLPEIVIKVLISHHKVKLILEACIDLNFTPSLDVIVAAVRQGASDDFIHQVIKSFSTIPYSAQFLMELINLGYENSAVALLSNKGEFRKDEVVFLALSRGWGSEELSSKIINNKDIIAKVLENIISGEGDQYPVSLLNLLALNTEISPEHFLKINKPLNPQVTEALLLKMNAHIESLDKSIQKYKSQVSWNPHYEEIEPHLLKWATLINVPASSKYRRKFLKSFSEEGSDEELLEISSSTDSSKSITLELLSRGIGLAKKVSLDQIELYISPSELAKYIFSVKDSKDILIYLYNNISSKYKPALQKYIQVEDMDKVDNSRKKSYFIEAFQGLVKQDLSVFRQMLSYGYDVEKFAEDCSQKSKRDSCENVSIHSEIVYQLTKKEFLALCRTKMRISYSSAPLAYPLTANEAFAIMNKTSVAFAYNSCDDKKRFLEEADAKALEDVWASYSSNILSDSVLLEAFLKNTKKVRLEFSNNSEIRAIASQLTLEEFKKHIIISDGYNDGVNNCLLIKSKDNEYIISEPEILERLKARVNIENSTLINDLIIRNKELATKVIDAYLVGNKGLTELLGTAIKITRQKNTYFQDMKNYVKMDVPAVVAEIFNSGANLEHFKEKLPHSWESALVNHSQNRKIYSASIDIEQIRSMRKSGIRSPLKIDELTISYFPNIEDDLGEVEINRVNIALTQALELKEDAIFLLKFIEKLNALEVELMEQNEIRTKIFLLMMGSSLVHNPAEIITEALNDNDYLLNCNFEEFNFLADNGLVFSKEKIEFFINNLDSTNSYDYNGRRKNTDSKVKLILSRVGTLDGFLFNESELKISSELVELLKVNSAEVLDEHTYLIKKIKNALLAEGADFTTKNIEELSYVEKKELIQFINEHIDPRYASLNFQVINLEILTALSSYSEMKIFYSMESSDIENFFLIPKNVLDNKKVLKSIKDLISVNTSIIVKIDLLKKVINVINPEVELNYQDFIVIDGSKDIDEADILSNISIEVLMSILAHIKELNEQSVILKNQKKASILRFLRTASAQESSYFADILESIQSIKNGVLAVEGRIETLSSNPQDNAPMIEELKNSINGIADALAEVSLLDDAIHMHDRLVKLAGFIKTDIQQPLNQDKFHALEKSSKVEAEFGYPVYFPKTRGELKSLGDSHGWCVNNNTTYGDGVISRGNILVGICEKGSKSSIDSVIALAHFLNKKGSYSLEQLKWSSQKKGGKNNQDATTSFKYQTLINLISSELEKKKV